MRPLYGDRHIGQEPPHEAPTTEDFTTAHIKSIIAERDLWRARCEAIVAMLEPGECKDWLGGYWLQKHDLHAASVKIMKGEE